MTNEELNNLMAEAMEWHIKIYKTLPDAYFSKEGHFVIDCKDWDPTHDPAQALMCADQLSENDESIEIYIYKRPKRKFRGLWIVGISKRQTTGVLVKATRLYDKCDIPLDELPLAICQAIEESINE